MFVENGVFFEVFLKKNKKLKVLKHAEVFCFLLRQTSVLVYLASDVTRMKQLAGNLTCLSETHRMLSPADLGVLSVTSLVKEHMPHLHPPPPPPLAVLSQH